MIDQNKCRVKKNDDDVFNIKKVILDHTNQPKLTKKFIPKDIDMTIIC
jgi:hypothetical protein